MTRESKLNVAEKERLRDAIAREVQRYLAEGGDITVVESPQTEQYRIKGSAWHSGFDVGPLFD